MKTKAPIARRAAPSWRELHEELHAHPSSRFMQSVYTVYKPPVFERCAPNHESIAERLVVAVAVIFFMVLLGAALFKAYPALLAWLTQ